MRKSSLPAFTNTATTSRKSISGALKVSMTSRRSGRICAGSNASTLRCSWYGRFIPRLKKPLLGARLRETRTRTFVGCSGEIELFRSALLAPDSPVSVLFLHRPGGVGKSSVLDILTDVAAADGATPRPSRRP
jgi:hypothetical protein